MPCGPPPTCTPPTCSMLTSTTLHLLLHSHGALRVPCMLSRKCIVSRSCTASAASESPPALDPLACLRTALVVIPLVSRLVKPQRTQLKSPAQERTPTQPTCWGTASATPTTCTTSPRARPRTTWFGTALDALAAMLRPQRPHHTPHSMTTDLQPMKTEHRFLEDYVHGGHEAGKDEDEGMVPTGVVVAVPLLPPRLGLLWPTSTASSRPPMLLRQAHHHLQHRRGQAHGQITNA